METVEGLVIDQFNNPVSDATISIVQATAPVQDIGILTDDNGRFFIDDLQNGRYKIRVFYGADQFSDHIFSVPMAKAVLVIRIRN